VQVCGIFLFVFQSTPWLRFSSCFYFGGGSCFIILVSYLCFLSIYFFSFG
jgi:hypothetical protein